MGLNIMGEDSRVERGGRDGRSSSGYSQEQPCKRSKDGEERRDGGEGRAATGSRGGGRNVLVKRVAVVRGRCGGVNEKGLSYCTNT